MDEVVFQRFVDGDDAAFTFIYNKYVAEVWDLKKKY